MPRLQEQPTRGRHWRLLSVLAACFVFNIALSSICTSLVLQESLRLRNAPLLASHGVFQGQMDRAWAVAWTHEKASGLAGGYTRFWHVPGASRLMLILLYEDKFRDENERLVSESVWGGFPFVTLSCERCYWLPALTSPPSRSDHPWKFGVGAAALLESDATFGYTTTKPTTTPIPYRPEISGLVLNPLIYAVLWLGINWLRRWIVRRRRQRRGCCPKCGYSLSGIRVSACPECGEDVA